MMPYHEQLKHPLWQKKRLEVMKLNNFCCENCGTKEEQLHVHHPYYTRGAMVWEYETTVLKCLCNQCHKDEHSVDEKIKKLLAFCDKKHEVIGYLKALTWEEDITLDSPEEITGFLRGNDIPTNLQVFLEKHIIQNNCLPFQFTDRVKTSFFDISNVCFQKPKNEKGFFDLMKKASDATSERMKG